MEAVLLTLALATCLENEAPLQGVVAACNIEEGVEGDKTLITACGLAPDKQGRPITLESRVQGKEYVIVLEPKCGKV